MKSFCQPINLNGLPCPVPLGTVRPSMKSMTRCARSRPAAVRLTGGDESGKLARRPIAAGGSDPRSGDWTASKLCGISEHLFRALSDQRDQRIDDITRAVARAC